MSSPACPTCGAATRMLAPTGGYPRHQCRRCRLEFLHPQPDDAALNAIYGRHYYNAWGIHDDEAGTRRLKLATFTRLIAGIRNLLPEAARILDVGCATGYFLEAARDCGFDAYGVELSNYGADAARRKIGAGKVHQGDLEDVRFNDMGDGQFDAVFMSDLIEHVRSPLAQLAAAHRQLKPGGLLIVTTPWTGTLLHSLSGSCWLHYKPEHLFYFGAGNLPQLMEAAGFKIIRMQRSRKCLSLAYAASQFGVGNRTRRIFAALLKCLPGRLLNKELWVSIGETTLVAQRRSNLSDDDSTAAVQ